MTAVYVTKCAWKVSDTRSADDTCVHALRYAAPDIMLPRSYMMCMQTVLDTIQFYRQNIQDVCFASAAHSLRSAYQWLHSSFCDPE